MEEADVPSGRIYSIEDIVRDPQYQARGVIEETTLDDGSKLAIPAVVPRLSATPGGTKWLGPTLGEHTQEVLADLGYDEQTIQRLRDQGVI